MKYLLIVLFLFWTNTSFAFFWNLGKDLSLSHETIDYYQPETDEEFSIPPRPYDQWDYLTNMYYSGLNMFDRKIPTYNKKGTLFSSWTPARFSHIPRPTVIIVHGGHGINPIELNAARYFRNEVNANVLILDSFWSRGKFENHRTTNSLGVDTRVLDVIAAYRWLEEQPEFDKNLVYVYGGSQGGWIALRLMTDHPFIKQETKGMFNATFSLYPFCREAPKYGGRDTYLLDTNLNQYPWLAPSLGPYFGRTYVFTGGKDTVTDMADCDKTIFTKATEWHHYPEGTHAWDTPNRGMGKAVDGECSRAKNPHNRFMMCRNDRITDDVLSKILTVIKNDIKKVELR